MENNENLVIEEVAENVEQTTEETPKTYTEAEFNAKLDEVLGKKIARREAKIRKEYDRKYGDLVDTLKAGTGKESVEEMTDTFRGFYQSKGIEIKKKPEYSDHDVDILARSDANEIISGGYDEVVEEFDRLANIGVPNMTAREKAVFKALGEHRVNEENYRELAKIGVTEDVYNSAEFKEFQKMFNPNTPISKVYETYNKTLPKKDYQTMGSVKNTASTEASIKEFYSPEEARQFTKADLDKNPELVKAIERSMTKWKR